MEIEANTLMKGFEITNVVHDGDMRKFEAFGSVEVVDRHNEIIPAEEIYKIMDIWMDRGAPINYMHSNQHIGKGLSWTKAEKDGKPGVKITGIIFKHYGADDEIWEGIKKGKFEGLSIGGRSYGRESNEDGTTTLKQLIGWEFSVVDRCGNQEATFTEVNTMAKSEEKQIKKEEEQTMDDNQAATEDDRVANLENAVSAILEEIASIKEAIAGKPEDEEAVEENKAEEESEEEPKEESKEEKPEESDEDMKKEEGESEAGNEAGEEVEKSELTDLKKQLDAQAKEIQELRKSTVVKKIEGTRPAEKNNKQETKFQKLNKAVDEMAKTGNFNFNILEKQIREE